MSVPANLLANQLSAADPTASAWVSASAGTGKTHVLTDRVLRLLLMGTPPGRILCLTFTKAAAAEMANRIHDRLGEWTTATDADLAKALRALTGRPPEVYDLTRARQLFATVLETPGGLKVQTIHSFCESLLGRFPLEAGLAPHFQVMDERTADELLQAARDRCLAEDAARPNPLIKRLTALVDEQGFQSLMKLLMLERGRLRQTLAGAGGLDGLVAAVRAKLRLRDGDCEDTILAVAMDDCDRTALRRIVAAMADGGKRDNERGAIIAEWLACKIVTLAAFERYCCAFFTENGTGAPFKQLVYKQTLAIVPDAEATLQAECQRLASLVERLKAVRLAEATAALLQLGASLLDRYDEEKSRRALLDYDDLILAARDLLHRPGVAPWVLYKLDGGIDHILIDEAQDTNPDQWQVADALAEEFFAGAGAREVERTIFAVGDPKQSIYSFQRADPHWFEAMRERFGRKTAEAGKLWRPVELVLSFRSTPAVLAVVDRVFADPAAREGLLAGDGGVRHISHRQGEGGLVEIWPTERPIEAEEPAPWTPPVTRQRGDNPLARLATRIARQIEGWLDRGERLESSGQPIRPGDILILVQRRAPCVEEMVRQLKRRHIPVAGVDRMVLTEQLAVMDLMALGRFLLLPEDDLTLATVLKSPLIGFDEEALFDLAYRREGRLWRALRRRRHERAAFQAAYERLSTWLSRIDFRAPFDFYAELLGAGGRERLVARLGHDANDGIDEFLGLALDYERVHAPSLQGFLAWLEAGQAEVKRDQEQRRDEVRIMTVHGAKGLQAPVVFLPDTCRLPDHNQVSPLFWLDGGSGPDAVLWSPRRDMEESVAAEARAAACRRRDEEHRRLFYVALTRARDRLYICGWEGKRARAAGCWYDGALQAIRELGQEVELEHGGRGFRVTSPQVKPVAPLPPAPAAAPAASLPAWARAPAPPEPRPSRPLTPSRPEADDPPVRQPLGSDQGVGFRRGNLIHRLLQSLPDLPRERRASAAARYLASPAHGLDAADQDALLTETLAVLEHPGFAAIFGPGSRAEVPVAARFGEQVLTGQIDRLLVRDEEVLIVDYKTNRPPPSDPADAPAIYLRQLGLYRAALLRIYPGRPVRCALLWTDGPRLMHVPGELLAGYAP